MKNPVGQTRSGKPLAGDWRRLVVFCAATPWDGNMMLDQHMAQRLAQYAPVLYVDPPLSVRAPWDQLQKAHPIARPSVGLISPGLARTTPTSPPGGGRRLIRTLTNRSTRWAMRNALRELGDPEVHAVVAASFAPVFGTTGERRRIFYSTDDFVAGADLIRVPKGALIRHERRQLRSVDTVVVCSPGLQKRYQAMGIEPKLVPNGCDHELFAATDEAPLPADVDLPSPVAGFVGHLTNRIDLRLLEAVAARGRSLLLVGAPSPSFDVRRLDRLRSFSNVCWVGPKPFNTLPSYLKVMDVGLLPYCDTEFNRASFPLKVLEYLAAGRGAVSTDLPAVRWLGTELIDIANSPSAFADAVDRALFLPRTAELIASRREFASRHGWSNRAEQMARAIGLEPPE
jgi:teichuronic acid biosynthesis glycosyltransferase TuaH